MMEELGVTSKVMRATMNQRLPSAMKDGWEIAGKWFPS